MLIKAAKTTNIHLHFAMVLLFSIFCRRVNHNIAEITIDGLSKSIPKTNIRITCRYAPLSGGITVACVDSQIVLMLASAYAVHLVTLSTSESEFEVSGLCEVLLLSYLTHFYQGNLSEPELGLMLLSCVT